MKQSVFRLAFLALLVLGSPTHALNFDQFALPALGLSVNQFVQPVVAELELMISPAIAKMRDVFVYELYDGDTPDLGLPIHRFDSNSSHIVCQIEEALPTVADPRKYYPTKLHSGEMTKVGLDALPRDDQLAHGDTDKFPSSETQFSVTQRRNDFTQDVCRDADFLTYNHPLNVSLTGLEDSEIENVSYQGVDNQPIFDQFTERLLVRLLIIATLLIWTTDLYFILPLIWKKGVRLLQWLELKKKHEFLFLPDPSSTPLPPMDVLMNPRKKILPASGMLQVLWSPELTETDKETILLKHMKKNLVKKRWKQASAMRNVVEFVKGKDWTESHMPKRSKKDDKETHGMFVHNAGSEAESIDVENENIENERQENDGSVDGEEMR